MTRKTYFFEGCSWFKFNNLGQALGITLKFYTSVSKEFKQKVRIFWGLIPTFVEITWEKLLGDSPSTPILNMFKVKLAQEARVNQFLIQTVENNEIFEISKMLKINHWVKVSYTKKANPCSLLDCLFCSVVPFLGKCGQKNWKLSV